MHIGLTEKASAFPRHFTKPAGLKKKKMKGKAHDGGDFQVQDFIKKKKKKKKHNESNNQDENAASGGDLELGYTSPVLFEDTAAQGGEIRKKKKKLKKTGEKQQTLIYNYLVEPGLSNGTGAAAASRKKMKREAEGSTDELSDVTLVPGNQECQQAAANVLYLKKNKKKKKKEEQAEGGEACEPPPCEKHREKVRRRRKKRRGGSAQGLPEQGRRHGHAGQEGAWNAAEVSLQIPAGFSTPTKAAGQAKETPAHSKKEYKNSSFGTQGSSSESDVGTPKALESHKKKQTKQNNSFSGLAASDEVTVDGEEELDCSTVSLQDLYTVRQELEEFIPHVKNISDSSVRKMAGRDLTRFREFKKQGIAVKFGRFTQKENKQIQKNVEEFLSLTGIDSAEKLLFTSRYPEDKDTIQHLKTEHHFCEKISEGIPRPWRLIYYRARKMFDPNNYKGRYTMEEKEKLKKYQALHGNDWMKISEMMSRSNLSVAMKYSEIKSAINYGPWTEEETQKLLDAVKEVLRRKLEAENPSSDSVEESNMDLWIDRERLNQPLPWTEIETKVGSRYWRQCKQKWNTILTSRLTRGQLLHKGINGLQTKINLIKRLYETKAEDAYEVNWDELSTAIGDFPRAYVQTKFYKLKVSSVPLWKRKTFSEIIDYLYEKTLPELEEKFRKEARRHRSFENSAASQQQQAFRLSDLFDSSEDSD